MTQNIVNKKLLIVDDEEKYRQKYSNLASSLGVEILLAENVHEGIEKSLLARPDAILTDKDMPDGTGNDLALAVRNEYAVRIVGITGGDSSDFREELFERRVSKQIRDEDLVDILYHTLYSQSPTAGSVDGAQVSKKVILQNHLYDLTAAYFLVQGYNLAKKLQRGEKIEELQGMDLHVPSDAEAASMLEMTDIGLDPAEIYATLCKIDEEVAADETVKSAFSCIINKQLGNISEVMTERVENIFFKILNSV
jgi:CheY-like chemotaxis protein